MTKSNMILMIVAISAITRVLVSGDNNTGFGCAGDVMGLMANCFLYVQKLPPLPSLPSLPKLPFPMSNIQLPRFEPSAKCCQSFSMTDIPCVCRYMPAQISNRINMPRFVSVSAYCGKILPSGLACGSKLT
ncbi:hypothetical protein L484_008622 [Morus notabilis]|uniref:Bifunctional inhibitor/plant lipid transfer protein/seed storage helical domain-containing protein n=1 Tax=Morus notabilis TaxID=981085 RepID=W9S4P9_9ROSA|nr:uncharacterized protein LOC21391982 [Morus notabilis]EXC10455.1 hypothetical protein L484_008622 [Morus notabilis]